MKFTRSLTRPFLQVIACCLVAVAAEAAAANPSAPAYNAAGASRTAYAKDCAGCGARICTRDVDQATARGDARPHKRTQAVTSREYCAAQLGSGYFPAEEDHIAAYLNKQYYPFE